MISGHLTKPLHAEVTEGMTFLQWEQREGEWLMGAVQEEKTYLY